MGSRTHKGMGGFGALQPHVGFAEFESKRQRGNAQKRFGRQEKQENEAAEWPRMSVGRKIDLKNGGNAWRAPLETLDARFRRFGRVLAVSELMVRYVSTDDMRTMLSERYDRGADTKKNSWRHQRVAELCSILNDRFRDNAALQINAENHSDDEVYDRDLWLPTRLQVGEPDVMDARRIGLYVDDEDNVLAAERRVFLETLSGQGFNTSGLRNRGPMLEILYTHAQVRLHATKLDMPTYPLAVPVQEPHAYWDTHQEY